MASWLEEILSVDPFVFLAQITFFLSEERCINFTLAVHQELHRNCYIVLCIEMIE